MRSLPTILALAALAHALPSLKPNTNTNTKPKPLPLLIWHGLGDRFDADGLQSTGELAEEVHPGTFVYYIRTDDDGGSDRTNTFFGNVTTQLSEVCSAIHEEPGLASEEDKEVVRADALGFSQGGQFLRALAQTCEGLEVRSLVTFGSQHNGISEFQECGDFDFLCKGATGLIANNVWTDFIQGKVVPAQYYREVNETTGLGSEEYLRKSNFLAHINNEKENKVERYKEKIAQLERFVMFVFEDDVTVIPKETGWFADVNTTSGEVTPLRERKLYQEDWLGLKKLDDKGGLVFKNTTGKHMELSDKDLRDAFLRYFGPERDFDASHDEGLPGYGEYEQSILYMNDALLANDRERAQLWNDEGTRILAQIGLATSGAGLPDEVVLEAEDEEFPGYSEWVRAICNTARAEGAEEKRVWIDEANRLWEEMIANGYQMPEYDDVEAQFVFYDDEGEEVYVTVEDEESPEVSDEHLDELLDELWDALVEMPEDKVIDLNEWFGQRRRPSRGAADYDLMSFWEKRKWEWEHEWLPWWRRETKPLSDAELDALQARPKEGL